MNKNGEHKRIHIRKKVNNILECEYIYIHSDIVKIESEIYQGII